MRQCNSQYTAALAITGGAIKNRFREKLYQELGLEYLYQRRWLRILYLLYKVFSTSQPFYIYDILPSMRSLRRQVSLSNMVSCKSEYFKNSFIPNVINEWNLFKFISPSQRKTFNIND